MNVLAGIWIIWLNNEINTIVIDVEMCINYERRRSNKIPSNTINKGKYRLNTDWMEWTFLSIYGKVHSIVKIIIVGSLWRILCNITLNWTEFEFEFIRHICLESFELKAFKILSLLRLNCNTCIGIYFNFSASNVPKWTKTHHFHESHYFWYNWRGLEL